MSDSENSETSSSSDAGSIEIIPRIMDIAASFMLWQRSRNRQRGGSYPGRRPNLPRNCLSGHINIWNDYFSENPVYSSNLFRRRFRMRKALFVRILNKVRENGNCLEQAFDALGNPGLSSLQKCVAAIRMLAYGGSTDSLDEYIRASESTVSKYMIIFCKAVCNAFADEYLRHPTPVRYRQPIKAIRSTRFSRNAGIFRLHALEVGYVARSI